MTEQEIISKILKIQLYLTTKIINNRGTNTYKPTIGDEDQPLRDELVDLNKQLEELKNNKNEDNVSK